MATLEELEQAFIAADDAGNEDDAAFFQREIDKMRLAKAPPIPGSSLQDAINAEPVYDPAEDQTVAENVLAGIGQSMYQLARKAGQVTGVLSQDEIDEAAKLDQPLMQSGGGFLGSVAGNVAQYALPAATLARLGGTAGKIGNVMLNPSLVTTRTGVVGAGVRGSTAGALGGAQAALQPVTSDQSFLGNVGTGALFGTAGQGLAGALSGGGRVLRGLRAGGRDRAAQIIADEAFDPATVSRLQSGGLGQQLVPGSTPTTAEATRDIGLAGLERTMRTERNFAPAFAQSDATRNAARVKAIKGAFHGATPEDATAMRTVVQEAQGPALAEARRQTGAESGKVVAWIDRARDSPLYRNLPEVSASLSTVRNLIATPIDNAGRLSAARSVITDALANKPRMSGSDYDKLLEARRLVYSSQYSGAASEDALKAIKSLKPKGQAAQQIVGDMARVLRQVEKGKPDVASLYNARKHITTSMMKGAGSDELRVLKSAVSKLDEQIGKVAPTYKAYLREYAAGMKEADQATIGAALLGYGASRPSSDVAVDLASTFVNRTRDLDSVVRGAKKFPRATAEKALTKPQLSVVEQVRKDLDSAGWVQSQSRASKNSITPEATAGQKALGRAVSAPLLAKTGMAGMAGLAFVSKLRAERGERVANLVYEALASPDRAAEILAYLPKAQRAEIIGRFVPVAMALGPATAAATAKSPLPE